MRVLYVLLRTDAPSWDLVFLLLQLALEQGQEEMVQGLVMVVPARVLEKATKITTVLVLPSWCLGHMCTV